ncbi:unnamed protein product [Amoebophrya sp. A120]|nr:unnamed protein product [Amoebophrya sp. A120]|eukprot:GSA120T00012476001.1
MVRCSFLLSSLAAAPFFLAVLFPTATLASQEAELMLSFMKALPTKKLSKTEESKVLEKLEEQENKIAGAVKRMAKIDSEAAKKSRKLMKFESSKSKKLAGGKGEDSKAVKKAEALEKSMEEWDEKMDRLNRKSRIGAVNVLSKLRNMQGNILRDPPREEGCFVRECAGQGSAGEGHDEDGSNGCGALNPMMQEQRPNSRTK